MATEPSRLPAAWLATSAVLFGMGGAVGLFLPVEAAAAVGWDAAPELPLQLAAAAVLSLANLNWLGRGAIYGGIYGRPIVLANLTFGMVSALVALSAAVDGDVGWVGWMLAGGAGVHAGLAARVLMGVPSGGRTG